MKKKKRFQTKPDILEVHKIVKQIKLGFRRESFLSIYFSSTILAFLILLFLLVFLSFICCCCCCISPSQNLTISPQNPPRTAASKHPSKNVVFDFDTHITQYINNQ